MKQNHVLPTDYYAWLDNFKATIRSKQIKAALLVNAELIQLYWDLGKRIDEKSNSRNGAKALSSKLPPI